MERKTSSTPGHTKPFSVKYYNVVEYRFEIWISCQARNFSKQRSLCASSIGLDKSWRLRRWLRTLWALLQILHKHLEFFLTEDVYARFGEEKKLKMFMQDLEKRFSLSRLPGSWLYCESWTTFRVQKGKELKKNDLKSWGAASKRWETLQLRE